MQADTYPNAEIIMEKSMEAGLKELLDRQAIRECIYRYCRGVDRFDRDLVLSAYHADAVDDHGEFVGPPEAFVDWAFDYHQQHQTSHHHMVLNHSCELDGDVAHSETYWLFVGENRSKPNTLAAGRYIDRLERRDGRWGIAARICVTESVNDLTPTVMSEEVRAQLMAYGPSARDRSDVSYERPLKIKHPHTER